LRNPIDRAFSHHNYERSLDFEDLSFEEAVAMEPERLEGEEERLVADPRYQSFSHQHHSYLARGRYDEQLRRWFAHVDRTRFLVLRAEDLFSDPEATVLQTQEFLGLDPDPPHDLSPRNALAYAPIGDQMRVRLRGYFEPSNQRLYELLGRDLGWE
jgi:hypothetical protein